jgi:hypothetical protein
MKGFWIKLVLFAVIMTFLVDGCGTYVIPTKPETKTEVIEMASRVKWPSEPCHHLKELTNGLDEDHQIAVVLAANKACINNLEEALKETGVKPPK